MSIKIRLSACLDEEESGVLLDSCGVVDRMEHYTALRLYSSLYQKAVKVSIRLPYANLKKYHLLRFPIVKELSAHNTFNF